MFSKFMQCKTKSDIDKKCYKSVCQTNISTGMAYQLCKLTLFLNNFSQILVRNCNPHNFQCIQKMGRVGSGLEYWVHQTIDRFDCQLKLTEKDIEVTFQPNNHDMNTLKFNVTKQPYSFTAFPSTSIFTIFFQYALLCSHFHEIIPVPIQNVHGNYITRKLIFINCFHQQN